MNFFQKLTGHFSTITRHRHKVIAHCAKAGILWQGLRHDLSKYTPTEFIPGVKYYMGDRSPNEGERMTRAILRHGYIIRDVTDIILNIGLITI